MKFVAIFCLLLTLSACVGSPSTGDSKPKLIITVEDAGYSNGFFKIRGTVKNLGSATAENPYITLRLFDGNGQPVKTEKVYIEGYESKSMDQSFSGPFANTVPFSLPPAKIDWKITSDLPYQVIDKTQKQ